MQRTMIEPMPELRTRFKMRIDRDGVIEERAIVRLHLFNSAGESAVFDWLVDETGKRAAQVALVFNEAAVARTDAVFKEEKIFFIDRSMHAGGLRYAEIWLHENLLPRRLVEETPLNHGTTVVRMRRRFQLKGMDVWFYTLTDPRSEPHILNNAELNESLIEACSNVADLSPNDKNDAWI